MYAYSYRALIMKKEYTKTMKARSGLTLVELLVALVISCIVFSAWMNICNIQAVRKESLRFEAVERAAGILDMVNLDKFLNKSPKQGYYSLPVPFDLNTGKLNLLSGADQNWVWPLFMNQDPARFPIGYRIRVDISGETGDDWEDGVWVFVELYDRHSAMDVEAGSSFCILKVLVRRLVIR